MGDLVMTLLGNAVALYVAFKLWRWSRRQAKSGRMAWRRRVGLLFFFGPILLTIGKALRFPDVMLLPLQLIAWANQGLELLLGTLLGLTREHLDGLWAAAVKPLCYAAVYGGVGVLIGWPLDRLKAKREAEAGATGAAQPDGGDADDAELPPPSSASGQPGAGQSDGSSPA